MNKILILLSSTILLAGCGSNPPETTMRDISSNLPDWVLDQRYVEDGTLFGVGVASGIRNKALAIKTAENRARVNIVRVFRVDVEAIIQDYTASMTASEPSDPAGTQNIVSARRTLIDRTLDGIVITDRFIAPEDGTVYVRAKLDLDIFEEYLEKADAIDAKMKSYVLENSKSVFEKLDKHLEKGKNP